VHGSSGVWEFADGTNRAVPVSNSGNCRAVGSV
jgi:hypothetical protein